MAKDWPSKQPAPQSRPSTSKSADEAGTPKTGFDDAPQVGLAGKGPGKGVPANNKKIH